jgi:hypothetical protein
MKKSLSVITLAMLLLMLLIPMMGAEYPEDEVTGRSIAASYDFNFMTPTGPSIPVITPEYIDIELTPTPTGDVSAAQTSDNSNMVALIALTLCSLAGVGGIFVFASKKKGVN